MSESRTVLVVDDDESIVDLISLALEEQGYTVLSAIDGAALRLARERAPGVILLDIEMPVMDGVEVSRRLREDPRTAGIPIVAMSAQERLDRDGAAMQADDRLAKPFRLDRLFSTVARWSAV